MPDYTQTDPDKGAPGQPAPDRAEPALARAARLRRRRLDAAVVLPVLGAVLFLTPIADAFAGPARLAGAPLGAVFIFGAWLGLIVAAARLAPGLAAEEAER